MDAISTIENSNVLIDFSSSRLTIQDDDVDLLNITENVNANGIEQLSREEQESVKKFNDFRAGQEYVLLLASTYINEAAKGRNGYFIPEPKPLRMYYWYNHKGVRLALFLVIWINLSLVFFEEPAVDGVALPYWITMMIELVCVFGYFLRLIHGWKFMPLKRHWKDRKNIIVLVCIILTLFDMGICVVLKQVGIEKYAIRWTRVLRPAFMVNFSETRQVRRTIRNIRRIIPEISSVLVLFLLVIGLYSLLGLTLFESRNLHDIFGKPYFTNYWDIYFNLYVLTTTANNPDIMIPAYNRNNWFSLFFIVFTIICMYIFVSIFLAVVYKNYRTHLKNEVKSSVYRKRRNMKLAFDCLKTKQDGRWVVSFQKWKQLIHFMKPKMNPIQVVLFWRVLDEKEEQAINFKCFVHLCDLLHVKMDTSSSKGHVFLRMCPSIYMSKISEFIRRCVQHRFFVYFFDVVIFANAVCIGLNEDRSETAFITLFNVEIVLKLYTSGPRKFVSKFWNVMDTIVIGSASLLYILEALFQVLRYSQIILDFLLILRVLRLFKIIGNIERFQVIINTILQIGPAIVTYGGIMFVLYYIYAIFGMELFQGHIKDYATSNLSSLTELQLLCGNKLLNGSEYVRLYYCEKNFNNIVKSYMILFDLTVVNQWHVLTDGYVRVTSKAARLYFFSFHMVCVIVVLNIFVAFILEAFMLQFSLSKGKFEAAFERKIEEKGRASSNTGNDLSALPGPSGSLQRLDVNFAIDEYMSDTGVTFKLRKNRTKNAELLLQQMFEDELDEKELGAEFDDNEEELEELVENEERIASPRKLTLQTVDLV